MQTLKKMDLVALFQSDGKKKPKSVEAPPTVHLTNPYDSEAELGECARSYLHVNCALPSVWCRRHGA